MKPKPSPLNRPVRVINMGVERFAEDLRTVDVPVLHMDWRPPAGGDKTLIALLDQLAKE